MCGRPLRCKTKSNLLTWGHRSALTPSPSGVPLIRQTHATIPSTQSRRVDSNHRVTPPGLTRLSHDKKDVPIVALLQKSAAAEARIATQDTRIAALDARIDEPARPPKTLDNSSKSPSQGQKQDTPATGAKPSPRKGRPREGRTLHPNPDRACQAALKIDSSSQCESESQLALTPGTR